MYLVHDDELLLRLVPMSHRADGYG